MDFVTIESFVRVCNSGSFTRASEEMYISQSALSKRIALLESEFGVQLIDRSGPGIKVTNAGRIFLEKSRRILELQDETNRDMNAVREGITSVLRVGFMDELPIPMLTPAIEKMAKDHPEVELEFQRTGIGEELSKQISRGRYDLVMAMRENFQGSQEIVYRLVCRYRLASLVGYNHPLSKYEQLAIDDLMRYKLVLYTTNDKGNNHVIAKCYEKAGYDRRKIKFVGDVDSMIYYVVSGRYVGLDGINIGGKHASVLGQVRQIPFEDVDISSCDIVCAYRALDRVAETFADIIVECRRNSAIFGETC